MTLSIIDNAKVLVFFWFISYLVSLHYLIYKYKSKSYKPTKQICPHICILVKQNTHSGKSIPYQLANRSCTSHVTNSLDHYPCLGRLWHIKRGTRLMSYRNIIWLLHWGFFPKNTTLNRHTSTSASLNKIMSNRYISI